MTINVILTILSMQNKIFFRFIFTLSFTIRGYLNLNFKVVQVKGNCK